MVKTDSPDMKSNARESHELVNSHGRFAGVAVPHKPKSTTWLPDQAPAPSPHGEKRLVDARLPPPIKDDQTFNVTKKDGNTGDTKAETELTTALIRATLATLADPSGAGGLLQGIVQALASKNRTLVECIDKTRLKSLVDNWVLMERESIKTGENFYYNITSALLSYLASVENKSSVSLFDNWVLVERASVKAQENERYKKLMKTRLCDLAPRRREECASIVQSTQLSNQDEAHPSRKTEGWLGQAHAGCQETAFGSSDVSGVQSVSGIRSAKESDVEATSSCRGDDCCVFDAAFEMVFDQKGDQTTKYQEIRDPSAAAKQLDLSATVQQRGARQEMKKVEREGNWHGQESHHQKRCNASETHESHLRQKREVSWSCSGTKKARTSPNSSAQANDCSPCEAEAFLTKKTSPVDEEPKQRLLSVLRTGNSRHASQKDGRGPRKKVRFGVFEIITISRGPEGKEGTLNGHLASETASVGWVDMNPGAPVADGIAQNETGCKNSSAAYRGVAVAPQRHTQNESNRKRAHLSDNRGPLQQQRHVLARSFDVSTPLLNIPDRVSWDGDGKLLDHYLTEMTTGDYHWQGLVEQAFSARAGLGDLQNAATKATIRRIRIRAYHEKLYTIAKHKDKRLSRNDYFQLTSKGLLRLLLRSLPDEDWCEVQQVQNRLLSTIFRSLDSFVNALALAYEKGYVVCGRRDPRGEVAQVYPTEIYLNTGFLIKRTPEAALPALRDSVWFVAGGSAKPCDRFLSHKGCGRSPCQYLHVQPRIGPCVDNPRLEFTELENVLYHECADSRGWSWFTAVYLSRETNIHYKAEGGNEGRWRRDCDVFWYPSQKAALVAVSRVYAASKFTV